ncbi:MAG: hypothetical protein ACRD3W_17350, partial [Terriglobales bacterium]
IGSQFNNVEDLQCKLMDRVAPDKEASQALIEVILKVEEVRKQNAPLHVLLSELRACLLKERLARALQKLKVQLRTATDEDEQTRWQSKIMQLSALDREALSSASTIEDLDRLKRKIEEVTETPFTPTDPETTV